MDFIPKVKLQIAVGDDMAPKVLETIETAAKTDRIGDGKIYSFASGGCGSHQDRRKRRRSSLSIHPIFGSWSHPSFTPDALFCCSRLISHSR